MIAERAPMRHGKLAAFACVLTALAGAASTAFANGAYPDGLDILLPTDRPRSVALATNFGIISSQDDGLSWQWACEQPETSSGRLYALGPAPADAMYAMSSMGLADSRDQGCTWQIAAGAFPVIWPIDSFADPNDSQHVVAIGVDYAVGPPGYAVYSSRDAGTTFTDRIYAGRSGAVLTGVEIAHATSQTIAVTLLLGGAAGRPSLARSTDGGATFREYDLSPSLGPVNDIGLIGIDVPDPFRVFLRVKDVASERLAIVDVGADGGAVRVQTPLTVTGKLTGLLHRSNGTLLVAGLDSNNVGVGFRSTDAGATFSKWPTIGALPALRALAERNGSLYGAADDLGADGFALGVSSDEGETWAPLMKYSQVTNVAECAASQCLDACRYEASLMLWSSAVCNAMADAATPSGEGGAASRPVDAGDSGTASTSPVPVGRSGGCALGTAGARARRTPGGGPVEGAWILAVLALRLGRCRKRARPHGRLLRRTSLSSPSALAPRRRATVDSS